MEYIELNIRTENAQQAEILTALLSDYPFDSFVEEDAVLKAYILLQDYAPCEQEVARMLLEQGIEQYEAVPIEQQNWNAEWESDFEPVRVEGERPIVIRAAHHAAAAAGCCHRTENVVRHGPPRNHSADVADNKRDGCRGPARLGYGLRNGRSGNRCDEVRSGADGGGRY